jgi:heavy metal sensor kinase
MSIRAKLTLYWTALLAAVLAAAAATVLIVFERQQWGALDAALMEEADTSAASMAQLDRQGIAATVARLSAERDLGPRRRVRVIGADGAVIADGGEREADLPVAADVRSATMLDGDRRVFRFAVAPMLIGGRPARLEDGVDASAVRNSIGRLRASLMFTMPLLLALCAAGGYWLAGRALAPVGAIAAELASIDPRDLSRRLAAPNPNDEIGRLTAVLNAMLERVERASTNERRFAADAAHELRTPLSVLRSGLEVALSRGRPQAEDRAALDAALDEVIRLCRISEDLLMMARLDGQVSISRVPVNLRDLLSEVAANIEPLAEAKHLGFDVRSDSDAVISGEPGYLKRLLLNLLDNAIKFTPAKGRIELSLEPDREVVRIRVADTGPGITPSEMPLLFERFYRGSAGREAGGSGLGLSLCREIARLHGGEISAGNRSGGGSEFIVTLPLRR